MNAVVVVAHSEPRSFNAALAGAAVEVLRAGGDRVELSDLCAMGFKAVDDASDFAGGREDPDFLRVDREQTFAHVAGTTAPDIRAEQEKLARADLLVLQFPIWWFGPPAVLKGWFDRVLTRGFAYLPGHKYDTGLMRGKRALVSVTTGTSADTYAPDGIDGGLLDILWPVHNGLLAYCGFDVLEPFATFMPRRLSDDERVAALATWQARLEAIESSRRLFFHPRGDYGPDERLLAGVMPRSGFQHRVEAGPA